MNGKKVRYTEDGKKYYEVEYKDGKKNGKFIHYRPDGDIEY